MYWGNVLEPIVVWHYRKRTKNKVRRINAVLQHPDPELPWSAPDRAGAHILTVRRN